MAGRLRSSLAPCPTINSVLSHRRPSIGQMTDAWLRKIALDFRCANRLARDGDCQAGKGLPPPPTDVLR